MCCVLDMEDWKELKTRVLHYIAKKPIVSGIITVVVTIVIAIITTVVNVVISVLLVENGSQFKGTQCHDESVIVSWCSFLICLSGTMRLCARSMELQVLGVTS